MRLLILLTLSSWTIAQAQITVRSGSSFSVSQGTSITFTSVSKDTLAINSGASLVNNGEIYLSDSMVVVEAPGFPITGNGFEFISIPAGPVATNPANLGLHLSGTITSSTSLKRYHTPLQDISGNSSISRYFEINPPISGASFQVDFNYDQTEINGLSEADLMLYDHPSLNSWIAFSGTADPAQNFVSSPNVNSLSRLTLFDLENVSVEEITAFSLQVFPNPTNGFTTVRLPEGQGELTIVDPTGRTVFEQATFGISHELNLNHLPAGIYFIRFYAATQVYSATLVRA